MTAQTEELKDRVMAKRRRMEAKVLDLKADASEASRERARSLERELEDVLNHVRDGFEDLSDQTVEKLNEWLKK